jgi:hypothetical protein
MLKLLARTKLPTRLPGFALCCALLALPNLSAAAGPCDGNEFRAFDFWLGNWQVHNTQDGKLVGHNHITREHGGCVLHERYSTPKGYNGSSLNLYDATRKVWHQTWGDNSGTLLLLEGGLRDDKMVLEGHTQDAQGNKSKQRISWTPNPDGTVRQLWEAQDAKGQWTVAFDGMYRKKP